MGSEKKYIMVTTKILPTFYKEFACIMDRCQDNCCSGGWNIYFSKKDYLKVKRAKKSPELEEVTKNAMRRLPDGMRTESIYAEFVNTQDAPCPFQSEEGLCRLQLGCGESTLPNVCQNFPRMQIGTAMGRFYILSLACEAVVELLWNLPQGIDFIEEPLHPSECSSVESVRSHEIQPLLLSTTIDILQARNFTVPQRLLLLGIALEDVKNVGFNNLQEEKWIKKVETLLENPDILQAFKGNGQNKHIALLQQYDHMKNLVLDKYWNKIFLAFSRLERTKDNICEPALDFSLYQKCEERFQDYFGDIEYFWENILVNNCFPMQVPSVESEEKLWRNYINLCNSYSFFRIASVMACGMEPSREKLFKNIVMCTRALLHDRKRTELWSNQFYSTGSESLAHMALLLQL